MAISLDALDADLNAIHDDLPETATFDGDSYTVNRLGRITELDSRRTDFIVDYEFTLSWRIRDFNGSQPDEGSVVTFNGIDYRVLQAEESPDALELRTHLGAKFTRRQ